VDGCRTADPYSAEFESLRDRALAAARGEYPRDVAEKLARIVLDQMYQFVALLDARGTLLEVNRAALEGAGSTLDELVGKPFWEAHWWTISPETQARLRDAVSRAAEGEFIRYDVDIWGEKGGTEPVTIDFSLIPIHGADGRVVFLLPEGRIITEKKQAEAALARTNEELRALNERLREFDQLKSQFFANVSHELRTPLALVLGPAERLLDAGDRPESERRDLEVIRRNARLLLKHVNDLLDLAKLDAQKMGVRYAETDVARLVRLAASHFDALAHERDIAYTVEAPDRLVVQLDAEKVERAVMNLLSNPFKFTPPGRPIRVVVSTAEGRAHVEVHDGGPGVPAEQRARIFERFRQADGASTRQAGGTGLGLAIVKEFTELHGGTVAVRESEFGGACFAIELPLSAPAGACVDDAHPRTEAAAEDRPGDEGGASQQVREETPWTTSDAAAVVSAVADDLRPRTGSHPVVAASDAQENDGRPLVLVVERPAFWRR